MSARENGEWIRYKEKNGEMLRGKRGGHLLSEKDDVVSFPEKEMEGKGGKKL
jgi:hypothetical protein